MNSKKPLVSIIIPVYNSSLFLRDCLESILKQKYKNYEVIMIDDGSYDGSSEICLEYKKRYKHAVYKKIKNSGVSVARNKGIDLASGDYICFVDSDDMIDDDYLSCFVDAMSKNSDADMIFAGYKKNGISTNDDILAESTCLDKKEFLTNGNYCYLFDKLFKATIIKSNKIRFRVELGMCEDRVFVNEYLKWCDKVIRITAKTYFYRTSCSSASRDKTNPNWFSIYKAYDLLMKDNIDNGQLNYMYIYYLYKGKYRLKFINGDKRIKEDTINRIKKAKSLIKTLSKRNRVKYTLYKYFWFVIFPIKEHRS